VDELARALAVSPRWLERRFQSAVGVTPKRLGRLVRFRRALADLDADPERAGVAVALDHGYYDQAHFIAEFRAFAGDAPRRFVEHRLAELTRFFVDRGVAQ
jgi:transcriptional regulator GlxA family with amidase domain